MKDHMRRVGMCNVGWRAVVLLCGVAWPPLLHAAMDPALAEQIDALSEVADQAEFWESSARDIYLRESAYTRDLETLKTRAEELSERYRRLHSTWGAYFQSFTHHYYQKQWRVAAVFELEPRREHSRKLWAIQSLAQSALRELRELKSRLDKLVSSQARLEALDSYYASLSEGVESKRQALLAVLKIRTKVLSSLVLPEPVDQQTRKTQVRQLRLARTQLRHLQKKLQKKWDTALLPNQNNRVRITETE